MDIIAQIVPFAKKNLQIYRAFIALRGRFWYINGYYAANHREVCL